MGGDIVPIVGVHTTLTRVLRMVLGENLGPACHKSILQTESAFCWKFDSAKAAKRKLMQSIAEKGKRYS